MLREVVVDALSSYFDTNVSHHHHFFCVEDRNLVDIPGEELRVVKLPHPPPGTTVTEVDHRDSRPEEPGAGGLIGIARLEAGAIWGMSAKQCGKIRGLHT